MFYLIPGAIITGLTSDLLNARATSSVIMMYLAVPTVNSSVVLFDVQDVMQGFLLGERVH